MKHYKHKLNTNGYGHYYLIVGIIVAAIGWILRALNQGKAAYGCFVLAGISLAILLILVSIELHQDKMLNKEAIEADAKLEAAITKKSFALPYKGGMIWSEHLDGLYTYKDIVLQKLIQDSPSFLKPSAPSAIAVALAETKVDEEILRSILSTLTSTDKIIQRVAFIGLDRVNRRLLHRMLQKEYTGMKFLVQCLDDFEKAKEWLVD